MANYVILRRRARVGRELFPFAFLLLPCFHVRGANSFLLPFYFCLVSHVRF
jgi:hypothetical protein